jgi:DNA-3-methyladenine glycosylase I
VGVRATRCTPYHDTEWGRPVADDRRLFKKLSLSGFQAGSAG